MMFVINKNNENEFDKENAEIEIKLCAFFAAKDIPFLQAQETFKFFKKLFDDSQKLQRVKLDRKQIISIIRNVIAPTQQEKLYLSINYIQVYYEIIHSLY